MERKSRRKREDEGAVFEKGGVCRFRHRSGWTCMPTCTRVVRVHITTTRRHLASPRGQDGASRRYKDGEGEAGDAEEGVADIEPHEAEGPRVVRLAPNLP